MKATRFLWVGLITAVTLCLVAFGWLTLHMARQNAKTIEEAGGICLDQMAVQIQLHFESAINLHASRLESIRWRVPCDDASTPDQVKADLAASAEELGFSYAALYAEDESCETILGEPVELSEDFLSSAALDESKPDSSMAPSGETLLVLGKAATYPMEGGRESQTLAVGLPIETISHELSLDVGKTQVYSHIIRKDGTYVLRNGSAHENSFFDRITNGTVAIGENPDEATQSVRDAMESGQTCSLVLEIDGEARNVCLKPLPGTDWYLASVLPQGLINEPLQEFVDNRFASTLFVCGIVLLAIVLVFALYLRTQRRQMRLVEEARREADEANRAKSLFLSSMSHDIRTPMNAVMGLAEIALTKTGETALVEDCLRKITLSSKHLLELINDVLDMSAIESGKLSLCSEAVSLRETVQNVVGITQPQAKAHGLRFDVDLSNLAAERVVCDGVRLNQVLLNLLSNAVKFTPEGGSVRLAVSQKPSPQGAGRVVCEFSVADTGMGMSPDFQKRIFTSFEREDTDRVRRIEGTGLGMAIVKSIVDAMGGAIQVRSAEGKGSEFLVTVDLERADEPDEPLPSPGDSPNRLAGKRILVAEDQELSWEVARALLEPYGPELTWTANGQECLEEFGASAPGFYDAVLMDVHMPVMGGYEATRAIRALDRPDAATIPIVAMTADVFSEDVAKSIDCGMDAHVSKPIDIKSLVRTLATLLEAQEGDAR